MAADEVESGPASIAGRAAGPVDARAVRRPVHVDGARHFDLRYVRAGGQSGLPLLVIPGGPGLASVKPYRSFRAAASAQGIDVIMVEHRGVGLSRRDDDGVDLPLSALTINQVVDDLAAVLDAAGVPRAVVYGSSYGSYLAQVFGVRHPDRVAGMVLDSPVVRADRGRLQRENMRRLFWNGEDPKTAVVARALRDLVASGVVPVDEAAPVVQVVYEFAGLDRLQQLVDLLGSGRGRWIWKALRSLSTQELTRSARDVMEFDLVGVIAFRELGFAPLPDGGPLEPGLDFLKLAESFPAFQGEPYDLPHQLPTFSWPTAVVSGSRDLRSPRAVAREVVDLVPGATLVQLTGVGHSALDTHPRAALHVARDLIEGTRQDLPTYGERLSELHRPLASRALGLLIAVGLTVGGRVPTRTHR